MTKDTVFPKDVQLAAQHSQRATGVPACCSLAQWALESAYGRTMSGRNNPFGIKGSKLNGTLCPTWEVVGGKTIQTHAYFRNFSSIDEAFAFHGRMLANPKGYYTHAIPHMHDWKAYIKAIAHPYATDPFYADKLIGIVDRWHLYELNLPATV